MGLAVRLLLGATLSCAMAAPVLAAAPMPQATATTASYRLMLVVGPVQPMWTQVQVQTQHPTTGEVAVLTGSPMAMPMTPGDHHVELHVWTNATGAVVTNANVTIALMNMATHTTTNVTPIMMMYSVTAGQSDWHYGNNATLPAGMYQASATVNGQVATFPSLAVPAATMPAMSGTAMPGATVAQQPAAASLAMNSTVTPVMGSTVMPSMHMTPQPSPTSPAMSSTVMTSTVTPAMYITPQPAGTSPAMTSAAMPATTKRQEPAAASPAMASAAMPGSPPMRIARSIGSTAGTTAMPTLPVTGAGGGQPINPPLVGELLLVGSVVLGLAGIGYRRQPRRQ